jgi:hypothetical protein
MCCGASFQLVGQHSASWELAPQGLFHSLSALLSFYWDVEKPAFEWASGDADLAMFRPLWDELQSHIAESSTAVV